MIDELFPVVDSSGNVIGSASRKECHSGTFLLHPVIHLHVFDEFGKLFLQHRSLSKDIQPGKWDTATGGHVGYGESISNALMREVSEELGITGYTPSFLGKYVFESNVERELVHVFSTTFDGEVHPNDEELDGGRFWLPEEINDAMGKGVLTPNFESEYRRFFVCKD